jgi:hypothetical protein
MIRHARKHTSILIGLKSVTVLAGTAGLWTQMFISCVMFGASEREMVTLKKYRRVTFIPLYDSCAFSTAEKSKGKVVNDCVNAPGG